MHNFTSQLSRLRLAIAPGVPSLQLSALLALQRAEGLKAISYLSLGKQNHSLEFTN
ncbi:hypothetical protein [Achromobacter aegrifaciens]